MSASRTVTIHCDAPSCGQWWERGQAETASRARAILKRFGWRVGVSGTDGMTRDYCPDHAKR